MGKIFNDNSNNHINDEQLVRWELHILAASYLEDGLSYFKVVLTENNDEDEGEANVKEPEVFDSKEEK